MLWDCGSASAPASEEDMVAFSGSGDVAAGCGAGFAVAERSAALNMPLRLSASIRS